MEKVSLASFLKKLEEHHSVFQPTQKHGYLRHRNSSITPCKYNARPNLFKPEGPIMSTSNRLKSAQRGQSLNRASGGEILPLLNKIKESTLKKTTSIFTNVMVKKSFENYKSEYPTRPFNFRRISFGVIRDANIYRMGAQLRMNYISTLMKLRANKVVKTSNMRYHTPQKRALDISVPAFISRVDSENPNKCESHDDMIEY